MSSSGAGLSKIVTLKADQLSQQEIYRFLISAVIPRPIAFVSTCNREGEVNLAPFSFYNAISSNPPCLMISIAYHENRTKKDTLRNIEETGEFVVNSAHTLLLEPLVDSAANYPYGVNEMELVGLTPQPSESVRPPRVKESALQFECITYKTVEIGEGGAGSTTVVFGKIEVIHVADSVYVDGKIDAEKFAPLARLGGANYATLGPQLTRVVPKV